MEIGERAARLVRAGAAADNTHTKFFVAAIVTCLLTAGSADAALVSNLGDPPPGEPGLAEPGGILDTLYGLDNLTRVSDSGDSLTDQYWKVLRSPCCRMTCIGAIARAKYSSYPIAFGCMPGARFLREHLRLGPEAPDHAGV